MMLLNWGLNYMNPFFQLFGSRIKRIKLFNKTVLEYTRLDGSKEILLVKSISYLGNPHPLYKKRIQIPNWYKDFCLQAEEIYANIRFIGIYEYDNNYVFVDFIKDTYLPRIVNNSSAHVYTLDIQQAILYGQHEKIDRNSNVIRLIRYDQFEAYLNSGYSIKNPLLKQIEAYASFLPKEPITAIDAIEYMYHKESRNWRQNRWNGWYFETLFDDYIETYNLESKISTHKNYNPLDIDLDLYFMEYGFYGDLKAHDSKSAIIQGNKTENILLAIKDNKVWYIVGEHSSKPDDGSMNKLRKQFSLDQGDVKAVGGSIKSSIQFKELIVIEINEYNIKYFDKDYQLGFINSDGKPRTAKISLKKEHLKRDDLVIARFKI